MEVKFKVNKQNYAYVRDEVRESLGYEWIFNLDNGVGIVYPADMDMREAIRRVKLNLEGLEIKEASGRNPKNLREDGRLDQVAQSEGAEKVRMIGQVRVTDETDSSEHARRTS